MPEARWGLRAVDWPTTLAQASKLGGSLNSIGGFTNSGGTVITNPGSTLITSLYSQSGGLTDVSGTLLANSYRQSAGTTIIETGGLVSATTFNATGGTVTVNGILDPTAVEIGSRGTLQGSGIINGNVVNRGNIIAGTPGNPSPSISMETTPKTQRASSRS